MTTDLPTLYVKSGCRQCSEAVEFLDEHGIDHREVNVTADKSALDQLKAKTGRTDTPTLDLDGAILADFNRMELKEFLIEHDVQLEDS